MSKPLAGRTALALGVALALLGATHAQAATVFVNANIAASTTWTEDNEYILQQPIYVTSGATLAIEPGTVIRGESESVAGANDPGTLIITRGAKIRAMGTKYKPIVFTNLDDDNIGANPGSFPYDDPLNALGITGTWGGVILLGRGYVANNTAGAANAAREVQIEGLTAAGGLGLYGNGGDDDDDSGTMQYVSIRYGGFNLSANNEINGLTLGAVGRETDLDSIEVFQNKDDGVEFFGGTVGIKRLVIASPGDDSLDYDEGWRGKVQFMFAMQGTPGTDKSDKGGEHDGGNSPDGSLPFAIPTVYNATYVGLGQKNYTNKALNTALHFRDNAGGRYYNSFFADFGGTTLLIEGGAALPTPALTSGERSITPYVVDGVFHLGPPGGFELELEDNCFWCFGNGSVVPTGDATANGGDAGKFHHDNGAFTDAALDNDYFACNTALPIRALTRFVVGAGTVPNPIVTIDPRPATGSGLLTTDRTAPNDGFYETAAHKGAFGSTNWADGWTNMSRLGYFPAAPTVNKSVDISASETWTADNIYVLKNPIYVKNGATLTIEPGTVIRGESESAAGANDPGTLIITRGSKIQAVGNPWKPIVFTNLDDDNIGGNPGTFPYDSAANALSVTGTWGGVILLGRGYVANNTAGAANAAREVQIEGLTAAGGLGLYGNGGNDDDDSGTMQYVSIRYGGFNLSANNEINGLTLGGVGRETDLDSIEVFQNKDDGVEFFGGTGEISHLVIASPGDDSLDYDEGWRGKVQFMFAMQGTPGTDKSDKGGEHDGGNSPDGSLPFAIPTVYNATYVGLGQKNYTNKALNTALHFRDNAGGRYYNSFFADFGGTTLLIEGGAALPTPALTSGERSITPYVVDGVFHLGPPGGFELELEDNCFWCFGNGSVVPTGDATANGGDAGKFHHDNGAFTDAALDNDYFACNTALPIRELTRLVVGVGTVPNPIVSIDPRPAAGSSLIGSTDRTTGPEGDDFLVAAPYKGAFGTTNWAAKWTNMARLHYFPVCNGGNNAIPDEVQGLLTKVPGDKTRFHFTPPVLPGGCGLQWYDVLRSVNDPADFSAPDCIESDDYDAEYTDADTPLAGECFYYLVRAENDCGQGSLGLRSSGVERTGGDCP